MRSQPAALTAVGNRPAAAPPFAAIGESAHYVVVEPDGWQLRRSVWGASAVLSELVAGPSFALRRISAREPAEPDGWLEHADAGILVDLERHVLLFFGTHRQSLPLDLRAALFAVLHRSWPGWSVRWAYGGTSDLMAYLGLEAGTADLQLHAQARTSPSSSGWYPAPWWSEAIGTLVTVRHAAGHVVIHSLDPVRSPAWAGPALVGRMPPGVRRLATANWPSCGLHLDLGRRSVGLWTASTFPGWQSSWFEAVWSGWDLEFWQDRIELQVSACDEALQVPPVRVPAGVVRLAHLLAEAWDEPRTAPHLAWLHGLEPAVGPLAVDGVTAQAQDEFGLTPTPSERRAVFSALHAVAAHTP